MTPPTAYVPQNVSSNNERAGFAYQPQSARTVGTDPTSYIQLQLNPNFDYVPLIAYDYQPLNRSPYALQNVYQHGQQFSQTPEANLRADRILANNFTPDSSNPMPNFPQMNPYYQKMNANYQHINQNYQAGQGFYRPPNPPQRFSQEGLAQQSFDLNRPVPIGHYLNRPYYSNESNFRFPQKPRAFQGLRSVSTYSYIPTSNQVPGSAFTAHYPVAQNTYAPLPAQQPVLREPSSYPGFESANEMFVETHTRLQNRLAERRRALPSLQLSGPNIPKSPNTQNEITGNEMINDEGPRRTLRRKLEDLLVDTGATPTESTIKRLRLSGLTTGKEGSGVSVSRVEKQPYKKKPLLRSTEHDSEKDQEER